PPDPLPVEERRETAVGIVEVPRRLAAGAEPVAPHRRVVLESRGSECDRETRPAAPDLRLQVSEQRFGGRPRLAPGGCPGLPVDVLETRRRAEPPPAGGADRLHQAVGEGEADDARV